MNIFNATDAEATDWANTDGNQNYEALSDQN